MGGGVWRRGLGEPHVVAIVVGELLRPIAVFIEVASLLQSDGVCFAGESVVQDGAKPVPGEFLHVDGDDLKTIVLAQVGVRRWGSKASTGKRVLLG